MKPQSVPSKFFAKPSPERRNPDPVVVKGPPVPKHITEEMMALAKQFNLLK
jgi:hypothetical protein